MASKCLDVLTSGEEFHLRDIVAVVLFIVGETKNNKGLGNDLFRVESVRGWLSLFVRVGGKENRFDVC